jgi:hypothetical protein
MGSRNAYATVSLPTLAHNLFEQIYTSSNAAHKAKLYHQQAKVDIDQDCAALEQIDPTCATRSLPDLATPSSGSSARRLSKSHRHTFRTRKSSPINNTGSQVQIEAGPITVILSSSERPSVPETTSASECSEKLVRRSLIRNLQTIILSSIIADLEFNSIPPRFGKCGSYRTPG